ncbi:tail protein [Stenotrophomonas phage BUCT626]|uniref:Tail protein n=1 Tax=Stenotrophomonas phage BUCT626 TaxID=2860376 RepID=A0AC61NA82_9CAUD|nr:tail protein [Stenotrophomonas phage BUCT626]QYC96792.1 tail protein [Stenotrophomonas phage BUCT626]
MDHNESRFILTPNPVALAGQKNVPLDLRPGESLYAFLNRHVPGLDEGKWVAVVNGEVVERQDWFTTFPKDGQLIELRGDVAGKSVLMIVAMVALTVFTFGIGAAAAFSVYGAAMAAGMGSMAATLAATAVYMVGAMLIQKVLGPKQETPAAQDTSRLNSLNGTNNRMRPYEPFGLLFGENVKISPDVLSRPYGYFQGDDQYLDMILTPGFNVHSVGPFMNGTTPLSDYQDVKVYHNNFSGMPSVDIPMLTNTFELPGGKLSADDKGTPGPVINRTTGSNTIMFSVGVAWTLYGVTRKGKDSYNQETIRIRYRPTGTNDWTQRDYSIRNIDKKEHRTEYRFEVPEGMYDIEVQALGRNSTGNSDQQNFQLTSIITARPDPTDYSFIPRIGINMKASGQLNGAPNELTTLATAKPTQVWNGTSWETKTTSNPGAQILQYLRGIYSDDGELLAGMGLPDEEIDIESLKAFMLHCAEHKFEYRHWITDKRSHENVIQSIANVAMGQMTTAGGKWAATWAAEDQPFTGVVNMATMTDASFEVSYTLANAADGIEYTYYNKTTDKTETVRVKSPTSTIDPINPATLTGEGVTDPEHAATLARYFLGQSLFQYKDISYGTAAEALSYKRMDKLMLQHDLTQWGFGGRVVSATRISGGRVQIVLDEPVPEFPTPFLGVRALGERVCRIFHVEPFSGTSNTLILRQGPGATGDVWPSDMPFPTSDQAPNFIWMYDFKATPGYPVRVVSIDPDFDQLAKVAVVWEGPEFWNYVYRGQYQRPDNASSLTDPQVQNLLANDYQVIQGNTRFTECQLTWEVVGNVRDCNVYMAGPDGILTQVGSNLTTRSHTFRLDYLQTYTFVVVPNSMGGVPGKPARIEYLPQTMGGGPALVDLFDVEDKVGGIRRYTWGFQTTTMSPDFDGVEIRYIAGATTGVPVWDSMIPLGDEDGFFTSAVEAVLPPAGLWTFACRSRNTSGELSGGMRYFSKTLRADIGENVDNAISGVENVKTDLEKEINDRIDGDIETAKKAADDLKAVNDALGQRITDNANTISQQAGQIAQNTNGLAQEILDRVAGDLNTEVSLTTKITEEKEARESDVENLTRMISSISAGSGEQFDQAPNSMWYFDKTVEGWSGVYGTPTIVDGWLRPANNTAGQNTGIQSPIISVDGAAYRFIKTRVRRKGNPQWLGIVRWITEADQNWNDAKSVTIAQPSWNASGIGSIEHADLPWNSGSPIRAIRFAFTGQQTATDNIEFDWIAIGRPTPGASVAMVQEEAQARIAADTAEALKRETLGVQMRGDYEGSDVAGVSQGLIASEKNARIQGDEVNAQAIQALTARMPAGTGKVASEASVTQLQQAMVSADTALGQRIDSLTAVVNDKASAAALEALTVRVTDVEGKAESTAQSVTKLNSNIGDAVNYSVIASSSISSSPSGAPRSSGVYRANGTVYPGLGASRGVRVATIKSDNTFVDTQVFDTYGDLVNNAIRFNAWYDAMTPNTWFIIYTSDAMGSIGNATNAEVVKMRANLIDAGMTSQDVASLGPNMFALIGRKLLSGGNGLYQVSPSTNSGGTSGSRDGVYVNMPFSLLSGIPMQQGDNARLSAATSAAAEAVQSLTTRVAESEGKIESMAESVTALTAKSNVALMGNGSNLWTNPTFDYAMDPWAPISVAASSGNTVTWANNTGQQGAGITIVRGNVSNVGIASNLRRWTSIEIGPLGRRIRQSIVAKSNTGSTVRAVLRLRVRSTAGEGNNDQVVQIGPTWTRYDVIHPIGDDRNEIMGELHVGNDPGSITVDRYEAFDITQEGRIDANAGAISTLQAQVKTIGDTTTANAQSIVKLNSEVTSVLAGGTSMFPSGDFEQFPDGQLISQGYGTTFTANAAGRRNGQRGLDINVVSDTTPGNNADCYPVAQYTPIDGARRLRVVAWMALHTNSVDIPADNGSVIRIGVQTSSAGAGGANLSWPTNNKLVRELSKTSWTKIDSVITLPANTAQCRLFISMQGNADPRFQRVVGARIRLDDIVITDVTDIEKAQQDATAAANAVSSLTTEVNRVGNKVDAQAQQITTLESSMAGVLTMGDNLIVNNDFELGLAPWVMNGQNNAGIKWDPTYGDGRPGVELNKSTASNPGIRANNAKWQALEANTRRIRVVIRARGVSGAGNIMVRINRRNTANQTAYQDRTNTFNVGAAFDTKNYDFDAFPGGTNGYMIEVYQYPNGGVTRIDSISAYDITNAVAIDATASAVSGLTTRVNTVEGVASANAQAITQLNTKMGDFNSSVWTQMQSDIRQTKDATTVLSQRVDGVQASVNGKADAAVVQRMEAKVVNLGQSGNLLANSTFNGWKTDGWYWAGNDGWGGLGNPTGDDNWRPRGVFGIGAVRGGVWGNGASSWVQTNYGIPVEANKTYHMSAYVNTHRCKILINLLWFDANNNRIGNNVSGDWAGPFGIGQAPNLSQLPRLFVIAKAPANATYARFEIGLMGTGESDPYFWLYRPMFSMVDESATTPPAWSAGGQETTASWEINMRADNKVGGLRLGISNQTAVFDVYADIFRISRPEGGARTEFSGGNWRVYDGNGVLRARLGVW